MKKPKVLIMRAAGTNCDRETEWAFQLAGAAPERVHVNELVRGTRALKEFQILVIPGGFSYGDDIAAGRVLAGELRHKLWDGLREFVARGKPVLGICNGFQVLVKSGLLPFSGRQQVTLGWNDCGRFEDRWVHLNVEDSVSPLMRNLPAVIRLPVAHAEGKFIAADNGVLGRLDRNKQVVFRYIAPSGERKGYPWNPNGSVGNIAGICDESGLVLGMMPHPERCLLRYQYPDWQRMSEKGDAGVGFFIFRNVVEYVL